MKRMATRAYDYQRAMRRDELVERALTVAGGFVVALVVWGCIFALLVLGARS